MTSGRLAAFGGIALLGGAIAVYAASDAWIPTVRSGRTVDADAVVVMPFVVRDSQTALLDLRDAIHDLLIAELPGGDGAPRAVLRPGGGGQHIQGEIAGTPDAVSIKAALVRTLGGAVRARARVEGAADSLPHLVERLAAQLLAMTAARDSSELAAMIATPPSALRAYLAGVHAYRRGKGGTPSEAKDFFERALFLDSTFTLAMLRLVETASWGMAEADERWMLDALWKQRGVLGSADRALLDAYLGRDYPHPATLEERIAAAERATTMAPHRIEAWRLAGRSLFQFGSMIGYPAWQTRATESLRRALSLDSTDAVTLQYLVRLAAMSGDTTSTRRYSRLHLAHNADAYEVESIRWLAALVLGDRASLADMRGRFDELHNFQLRAMIEWAPTHGIGLEDAARAARVYEQRAASVDERRAVVVGVVPFLLNRGRPREASRLLASAERGFGQRSDVGVLEFRIYAALYWDGDSTDAADAAQSIEAYLAGLPLRVGQLRDRQTALCALAQWRLGTGDLTGAGAALRRMRGAAPAVASTPGCVAALEAQLDAAGAWPNGAGALARLDSLLRPGHDRRYLFPSVATLIAARLHEARGDLPRALAMARRRNFWGNHLLATQLREEGRLAALLSDRNGAIRAYRHYLVLRSDPELVLHAETDRVRSELARIQEMP